MLQGPDDRWDFHMKLSWILNWTEIRSFSSVQFRSKKFVPASSALSSVQFRSTKRGRIFLDPHKCPKTLKKCPKTPKNAPKRPKTPQKRPKTPQNAPKTPVFWPENARFFQFSSVQVSFFRSGQFRSFQVSSGQVPDVQVSSVQVNLTCRRDPEMLLTEFIAHVLHCPPPPQHTALS
jgi:hypothetical protein